MIAWVNERGHVSDTNQEDILVTDDVIYHRSKEGVFTLGRAINGDIFDANLVQHVTHLHRQSTIKERVMGVVREGIGCVRRCRVRRGVREGVKEGRGSYQRRHI